jgi:hypothetical protein
LVAQREVRVAGRASVRAGRRATSMQRVEKKERIVVLDRYL